MEEMSVLELLPSSRAAMYMSALLIVFGENGSSGSALMNVEEDTKSISGKSFNKSFLEVNHVKEKLVLKKNATCTIVLKIVNGTIGNWESALFLVVEVLESIPEPRPRWKHTEEHVMKMEIKEMWLAILKIVPLSIAYGMIGFLVNVRKHVVLVQ